MSVFAVTRSDDAFDDSGNAIEGTLRHAILMSNQTPGPNQIVFDLTLTTITTGTLPAITTPVTIDATTEPGYANTPIVHLQPIALTDDTGLNISADDSTVIGLVITAWGTGIVLSGAHDRVMGCYIGTDTDGQTAQPNGSGIIVTGANAQIGSSSDPSLGNLISGNLENGISVSDDHGGGALIVGNKIGTDTTGKLQLANGDNGILITTMGNIIGGMTDGSGNLISGNGTSGIRISGSGAKENVVQGNLIGTDVSGTVAIPNETGVCIESGASSNTIGGTVHSPQDDSQPSAVTGMIVISNVETGNVISGNAGDGVEITDNGTDFNLIEGNRIGTTVSGAEALGNGNDGIRISSVGNSMGGTSMGAASTNNSDISSTPIGASFNVIGGANASTGNIVAYNASNGVTVGSDLSDMSTGNAINSNSIFFNLALGIDLGDDGESPNHPGGLHSGPNALQDRPVLGPPVAGFDTTPIPFTLNSGVLTKFHVEFFSSPSGAQGKTFLGGVDATTNGNGSISSTFYPSQAVAAGLFVTATATDPSGNTSEFSTPVLVTSITPTEPGPILATFAYSEANLPTIKLSWGAVTGAGSYQVFRGTAPGAEDSTPYATVHTTSAPTFTDAVVLPGTTYYYNVVAVGTNASSNASSETNAAVPHIQAPAQVSTSLSGTASAPKVILTWQAVDGADWYQVFRGTFPGGEGQTPFKTATSGIYSDTDVSQGSTYYYRIIAVGRNESSVTSTEVSAAIPQVLVSASWNVKSGSGSAPSMSDAASAASLGYPAYTLSLSGINGIIPIKSFSWGVSTSTVNSGGGGGVGKATATDFTLSAPVTGASPTLFHNAASGKHLVQGVLTAYDAAQKAYMSWTLSDVLVSSYRSQGGTDFFRLDFATLVATHKGSNPVTNAPSNITAGWNFKSNISTANAQPGAAFDPAHPPAISLTLGDGANAIVSDFTFGGVLSTTASPAGGGGAGKATFAPLVATVALGNGSPDFLSAALSGRHLKTVTLVQRDNAGKLLASWSLGDVLITSDTVSGSSGSVPNEVYKLTYATVTETTQAGGGRAGTAASSWNVKSSTGTDAASAYAISAGTITSPAYTLSLNDIDGVLRVQTFSWGVTGATVSAGGGGGKAIASDLTLAAPMTGASPRLFFDAAVGIHLKRGILTAYSASGEAYMTWTLSDVLVTSYSNRLGTDSLSLKFGSLMAARNGTKPVTKGSFNTTAGWNFKSNVSTATGLPGAAFDPAQPPAMSLTLGDGTNAVVSGFTFGGVSSPAASSGGGGGAGNAKFGPVTVTVALGNGSPAFLSTALSGRHLKTVTLVQRDSTGKLVASWSLGDVSITSDRVSGNGGGVPNEVYTLNYGTVTETTPVGGGKSGTASVLVNVKTGTATDAASANASAAGSIVYPAYTLSLSGMNGVIPVNSFSWGVSTTAMSSRGGGGGEKAMASNLTLSAPITGASPRLFFDAATGSHLVQGILTAYNAAGKAYMTWTLSDVLVTSYSASLGTDHFSLNFSRLTVAHQGINPVTKTPLSTSLGWNFKDNRSTASALPGAAFDPAHSPAMSLTLGDGTNAVVSSYSFGGVSNTSSSSGGGGVGKTTFAPVTVTAALGNGSANLLFAALSGRHLKTVILTQRDNTGKLIASWTLGDVLIIGDQISSANAGGVPSEVFTLAYGTVTETTPDGPG